MPIVAQGAPRNLSAYVAPAGGYPVDWDVSPVPTVTVQTLAGVVQAGFPAPGLIHDGLGLYHYPWDVPLAQPTGTFDVHFQGKVGGADWDGWDTVEIVAAGSVPGTTYYSTPEAVIARTGVGPADLGMDDDEALDAFLQGLLTEITDLLNRKMGRNYLDLLDDGHITVIPAGLSGIAADVAADSLRTMVVTRQTPVVRIDDFAVATIRSRVFSDDILDRLRLYGHHGVRSVTMSNR